MSVASSGELAERSARCADVAERHSPFEGHAYATTNTRLQTRPEGEKKDKTVSNTFYRVIITIKRAVPPVCFPIYSYSIHCTVRTGTLVLTSFDRVICIYDYPGWASVMEYHNGHSAQLKYMGKLWLFLGFLEHVSSRP